MENEQNKLVLLAEDVLISEESKLNPIFLTVDVKLCDSIVNANHEGVTAAFIEDVVNRSGDHVCLPFYADVKNLLAENYENLSHLYNKVTKKFGTSMIGSMSEFYSETDDDVVSLYAKIKIPKRDRDIVYRLVDLYEMGRFAVSVELSYNPNEVVAVDGGKLIDASENNSLNGACLVWRPACSDAYALDMVAESSEEIVTESEELAAERGEIEPMEKEKIAAEVTEEILTADEEKQEESVSEVVEETQETVAEEETVVSEDQKEETPEEEDEKDEEDVVAESQEENAEVLEPYKEKWKVFVKTIRVEAEKSYAIKARSESEAEAIQEQWSERHGDRITEDMNDEVLYNGDWDWDYSMDEDEYVDLDDADISEEDI